VYCQYLYEFDMILCNIFISNTQYIRYKSFPQLRVMVIELGGACFQQFISE
jgi:hypothetical protein